jgi:hypothetical protein
LFGSVAMSSLWWTRSTGKSTLLPRNRGSETRGGSPIRSGVTRWRTVETHSPTWPSVVDQSVEYPIHDAGKGRTHLVPSQKENPRRKVRHH